MKLDSARELKQQLARQLTVREPAKVRAFSLARSAMSVGQASAGVVATFALGVSHVDGDEKNFRIAVRIQRRSLESSALLDQIRDAAKGEVDVRYVGAIRKRQLPWQQQLTRPLAIGCSVSHFAVTVGTLGCFVRLQSQPGGSLFILSNNHVLADENRATAGDAILQPGTFDGGQIPGDAVARLTGFVRLERSTPNFIDGAIAEVMAGINSDTSTLRGALGLLTGINTAFLEKGATVAKIGRTTALTQGKVTAVEMDNVVVDYDPPLRALQFNNQIEIEGIGNSGFSDGGDSGSLIWSDPGREAIGLLFSGSDQGGANGKGLTYANPIQRVFDDLKVELAI